MYLFELLKLRLLILLLLFIFIYLFILLVFESGLVSTFKQYAIALLDFFFFISNVLPASLVC